MIEQLFQILGYLHGMWRYRWSGLLITWVAALVGLVVVMLMPNTYEARAVFHVDTQSILSTLLKGLAVEDEETNADVELVKRMMLSRENLLSVIRDTDMDLEAQNAQSLDFMVAKLANDIQISGGNEGRRWRGPSSNIYEISYSAHSPERVYKVVSSFLDSFIENTLNSGRVDTASAEAFLDKQIKEYEDRLVEAEQRLAQFKKHNVGVMPDERGGYYERLQRSETEAEETKTAIRLAERRLSELRKQLRGEKPVYSSSGTDIQARKAEYYRQLELLLTQYTEQHPDVIALKQKIENLSEGNSAAIAAGDSDSMQFETNPVYQELKIEESKAKIDLETLRLTLSDQQNQIEKLRAAIDSIPEVEAEYSRLNRDYEITNERYLELVERRESAQLAREAKQSSSEVKFRIIESPILPTEPAGPDRKLYSLVVFIGAIGLGVGWGLIRFLMHPTFIGVGQLKEAFTVPVLGSVGMNITPEDKKRRSVQLLALIGGMGLLALLFVLAIVFDAQLIELLKPITS